MALRCSVAIMKVLIRSRADMIAKNGYGIYIPMTLFEHERLEEIVI